MLLADEKRLVGTLAVAFERFHVGLGRHADHALERLHDRLLGDLGVALHALAVFQSARGFDDNARSGGNFGVLRVKIVHFSVRFETNSDYGRQRFVLLYL